MKKLTLITMSLLVATSVFALPPKEAQKGKEGKDFLSEARTQAKRNSEGSLSLDIAQRSVSELQARAGDKLRETDVNALESAVMKANAEVAVDLLDSLAQAKTVDADNLNTLLQRSQTSGDVQATPMMLGLTGPLNSKAALKTAAQEMMVQIQRGEKTPEQALRELISKFGTAEAKNLPLKEIIRRCKALLGIA